MSSELAPVFDLRCEVLRRQLADMSNAEFLAALRSHDESLNAIGLDTEVYSAECKRRAEP